MDQICRNTPPSRSDSRPFQLFLLLYALFSYRTILKDLKFWLGPKYTILEPWSVLRWRDRKPVYSCAQRVSSQKFLWRGNFSQSPSWYGITVLSSIQQHWTEILWDSIEDPCPNLVNLMLLLADPKHWLSQRHIAQSRVVDPHWFNADRDPAFFLIAGPDPDSVRSPGVWWPKIDRHLLL